MYKHQQIKMIQFHKITKKQKQTTDLRNISIQTLCLPFRNEIKIQVTPDLKMMTLFIYIENCGKIRKSGHMRDIIM